MTAPTTDPTHVRSARTQAAHSFELASSFEWDGFRLAYTEFGAGDRLVVLTHGLLMTRRMHAPLARRLAEAGFRVLTLDVLGHGDSDRPTESWRYSVRTFGEQVLALLDHVDAGTAVVGGTSLGANVALELGVRAPERLHGLLTEMPVLDNALLPGLLAFPPLLFAARFTPVVVEGVATLASLVPHGNQWIDVVTDTIQQEPVAMAAVLHGLLFDRIAPPKKDRRKIDTPTMVIGHANDPIHPFGDADTLAGDMPHAEFLQARSPVELRFDPERITAAMIDFFTRCYDTPGSSLGSGSSS